MASSRYRADELLARLGLCATRSAAAQIIKAGNAILPDGATVRKPGQMFAEDCGVTISAPIIYVSRGAGKLLAALEAFSPDIQGKVCLDLGASTGGFTDVLLRHGAAKVYAVDVGTAQLHESLRADARVVSLEQTNAKDLSTELVPDKIDVLTGDLSFISLTKVLPACPPLLADDAVAILLIKPQFELDKGDLGSGGVVRSEALRQRAIDKVVAFAVQNLGWSHCGTIPSPVLGPKGNHEFLAMFTVQHGINQNHQSNQL